MTRLENENMNIKPVANLAKKVTNIKMIKKAIETLVRFSVAF